MTRLPFHLALTTALASQLISPLPLLAESDPLTLNRTHPAHMAWSPRNDGRPMDLRALSSTERPSDGRGFVPGGSLPTPSTRGAPPELTGLLGEDTRKDQKKRPARVDFKPQFNIRALSQRPRYERSTPPGSGRGPATPQTPSTGTDASDRKGPWHSGDPVELSPLPAPTRLGERVPPSQTGPARPAPEAVPVPVPAPPPSRAETATSPRPTAAIPAPAASGPATASAAPARRDVPRANPIRGTAGIRTPLDTATGMNMAVEDETLTSLPNAAATEGSPVEAGDAAHPAAAHASDAQPQQDGGETAPPGEMQSAAVSDTSETVHEDAAAGEPASATPEDEASHAARTDDHTDETAVASATAPPPPGGHAEATANAPEVPPSADTEGGAAHPAPHGDGDVAATSEPGDEDTPHAATEHEEAKSHAEAKDHGEDEAHGDGEGEGEAPARVDTTPIPPGPTPFQLVRMMTALQDDIARGSSTALQAQRVLNRRIGERFRDSAPREWAEPSNGRALVTYALSGGDPTVVREVITDAWLDGVHKSLASGALAFVEGRADDARHHFKAVEGLPIARSVLGSVRLAQAALAVGEDRRQAMDLLEDARLNAPGTLVEEAALRREVLLAAEADDFSVFEQLVNRYLRKFRSSVYAGNFRRRLAAALTRMSFIDDADAIDRLDPVFEPMTVSGRQELYLLIARAAIENGSHKATQSAAARVLETAPADSLDHSRAELYLAAAEVVDTGRTEDAMAVLERLRATSLPEDDRALLSAALSLSHTVVTIPGPAEVSDAPSMLAGHSAPDPQTDGTGAGTGSPAQTAKSDLADTAPAEPSDTDPTAGNDPLGPPLDIESRVAAAVSSIDALLENGQ